MQAAWYEKQGLPRDVLVVGEMPELQPAAGEVKIRVAASGINPGDVKKLSDSFGLGMPFPRIIPHSDGAGEIDAVGPGVPLHWIGKRVWCFGAQSYRPFGTAAQFTNVPVQNVAELPGGVSFEQGACLGIPGITSHRAVHVAGEVNGHIVLVQGAAGSVGLCAVQLARFAGAHVIGTVRSAGEESIVREAGAHQVFVNDKELPSRIQAIAPDGIDHVVEVAFAANVQADVTMLKNGGSIATYATNQDNAPFPFWPSVFKNIRIFFLGSDDFPPQAKTLAAQDLNGSLEAGWSGFPIAETLPLAEIAHAHELVQHPVKSGRIVLTV